LFLEKIVFSCEVGNNSDIEDLALEFWIDGNKFFDDKIKKGSTLVHHEFNDDESNHNLEIILKNKTMHHTTVNEAGEIVSDALISIKDIVIDKVNIDQLFFKHAVYSHNYNGTASYVEEKFHGSMGCNGALEFTFTTPFYMWLLEHL